MSIVLAVGRHFGGLSCVAGRGGVRVCVGWIVVALYLVDVDYELGAAAARDGAQ